MNKYWRVAPIGGIKMRNVSNELFLFLDQPKASAANIPKMVPINQLRFLIAIPAAILLDDRWQVKQVRGGTCLTAQDRHLIVPRASHDQLCPGRIIA